MAFSPAWLRAIFRKSRFQEAKTPRCRLWPRARAAGGEQSLTVPVLMPFRSASFPAAPRGQTRFGKAPHNYLTKGEYKR